MGPRTGLDVVKKETFLAATGIRTPDRIVHSLVATLTTLFRLQNKVLGMFFTEFYNPYIVTEAVAYESMVLLVYMVHILHLPLIQTRSGTLNACAPWRINVK